MSRIGKKPVAVPSGVTVQIDGSQVTVKGPKGQLSRKLPSEMTITLDEGWVTVARPSDMQRHRALHGLTRSLLNNMVEGVTNGFTKKLEIQGVGYKAEPTARGIRVLAGYSHPVDYDAPEGIELSCEAGAVVQVAGIDKELVGQVAAEIRGIRPPEPYKGKGIRYVGEHVRRKAGKTGAKA
ncbi:MAG: 50S ribosomal protein L6 [Gemmatimonas sp. SG8_17]|nr:MAG: 50S ribosomal protein L6 [Gemmatimonas sp. SG8_17]